MTHRAVSELLQQGDSYVFPDEGRMTADAVRLSSPALARRERLTQWTSTSLSQSPLTSVGAESSQERKTRSLRLRWPWSWGDNEDGAGDVAAVAEGDGSGFIHWTGDGEEPGGREGAWREEWERSYEEEVVGHPELKDYEESTVRNMRAPPFLLPSLFSVEDEVQVSIICLFVLFAINKLAKRCLVG